MRFVVNTHKVSKNLISLFYYDNITPNSTAASLYDNIVGILYQILTEVTQSIMSEVNTKFGQPFFNNRRFIFIHTK